MTSLIKRLEALTGPSREVDEEIAKALGWTAVPWNFAGACGMTWYASGGEVHKECPRFTGSIDAARSICPDVMVVYASEIGGDGLPYVELCTSTATPVAVHEGVGATIEIAFCIAALKAREVINEN